MRLVLKTQNFWFPLLGALFFFLIGAGTTLALVFTDSPLSREMRDETPLPFLMMSTAAVLILVVGFIVIWLRGLSERAAIQRLLNNAWVSWAQYDSVDEWRAFAQQSFQTEMKRLRFPWGTLVVVVIIFTIVSGYTFTMASADGANLLIVALPLGAFFTFILIITLGRVIAERNKIRALRKRRLRSEPPNVYIGKQGMYSDDNGYRTFRSWGERLINVYYQAGTPATVNFQISIDQRYGSYTDTVAVRVPPGSDTEAENLAHRFFDEGVVKR